MRTSQETPVHSRDMTTVNMDIPISLHQLKKNSKKSWTLPPEDMWVAHRHRSHISSVALNFQDGDSQVCLFHLWSPSSSWKLPVKWNDINDTVVTDSSLFWSWWGKARLKWVLPMLQSHILNLFFSYKVKAVLDSNGMGPCPTLHSLGDKKGIDWALKVYTWNCTDASAKSKNETESSSVCPFTSHHWKSPSIQTHCPLI